MIQEQNSTLTQIQIQRKINQASLRIHNTKRRNNYTKKQIEKNKEITSKVLKEKQALAIAFIEQQKLNQRIKQEQQQKIRSLKKQNSEKRNRHKRQIRDILTALYLVKAEDASQLRKISQEHQMKMRQMSDSQLQNNRKNTIRAKSQEGKKQQVYWKNRLFELSENNETGKKLKHQALQSKHKHLLSLLEKSKDLQYSLKQVQKQAQKSKRQYFSAVNLPIKKVANIIEQKYPQIIQDPQIFQNYYKKEQSPLLGNKKDSRQNSQPHMIFSPDTQKSQHKLKIVLQKLRNKQKNISQINYRNE